MQIGIGVGIPRWLPKAGAGGGGTSYDAATEAIAAAFTTPPTTARKNLIDACVVSLKSAGVWAKLDALYLLAAADSQAAKINWKAPGTYNATEVNAPAFAADLGFTGAPTKYLDTGFDPNVAPSPKYTLNSATVFAHALTNVASTGGIIADNTQMTVISPRYTDNMIYNRVNQNAANMSVASTDSIGFWCATRTAAGANATYKNGASLTTAATGPTAMPTTLWLMRYVTTYWLGQLACGGFGSGLNSTEAAALYNAISAYMVGLATERIAAAFTTPPSAARKTLIQNCVASLMQAGVWDKLDALYAFAAADSQAAKINWKAPGTYNATEVNAPTFTADRGFTGASTKYLDSGFNPSTAPSPKFVQDNAAAFAWSANAPAAHWGAIFGNGGAVAGVTLIYPFAGDNNFYGRANCFSDDPIATPGGSAQGLWVASRTGSAVTNYYKNGAASFKTSVLGSTAPNSSNMLFLTRVADAYVGQIAAGGLSSSLNATEQTALYNALNTYLVGVGAIYQAETEAIAAAFTTPPTTARKNLIDACVAALKSAGVWAKLDCIYMLAAADSQAAKINWKVPGTYNCTEVNAPTFTADRGFTGASTKYLDTGFNPATAGGAYLRDSATAFAWSNSNIAVDAGLMGNTAGSIVLTPRSTVDIANGRINHTTNTFATGASTDSAGLWNVTRSSGTALELFRNGTSYATASVASIAVSSVPLRLIRAGLVDAYYTGEISCAGAGSHLNATEQTALYNALRTYMTGVGVP